MDVFDCAVPEYMFLCKKGFKILMDLKIKPMGGDGLGYIRATDSNRIHNILKGNYGRKGVIDHINRDKRDNRLSNLRIVTHQENCQNSSVSLRNKTGHKYISFSKHANKYRVVVGGKHCGYFSSINKAINVRDAFLESIEHPYSIKSR